MEMSRAVTTRPRCAKRLDAQHVLEPTSSSASPGRKLHHLQQLLHRRRLDDTSSRRRSRGAARIRSRSSRSEAHEIGEALRGRRPRERRDPADRRGDGRRRDAPGARRRTRCRRGALADLACVWRQSTSSRKRPVPAADRAAQMTRRRTRLSSVRRCAGASRRARGAPRGRRRSTASIRRGLGDVGEELLQRVDAPLPRIVGGGLRCPRGPAARAARRRRAAARSRRPPRAPSGSGIRQFSPSRQKSRLPWASVHTTAPPVAIDSSGGRQKPSCTEVCTNTVAG